MVASVQIFVAVLLARSAWSGSIEDSSVSNGTPRGAGPGIGPVNPDGTMRGGYIDLVDAAQCPSQAAVGHQCVELVDGNQCPSHVAVGMTCMSFPASASPCASNLAVNNQCLEVVDASQCSSHVAIGHHCLQVVDSTQCISHVAMDSLCVLESQPPASQPLASQLSSQPPACSATFVNQDLVGQNMFSKTVIGSSDAELDRECCSFCDANVDCQFWVREAGASGNKTCWLKNDAGTTFSSNADRRGALKASWPRAGQMYSATFVNQDLVGVDVFSATVEGSSDLTLDRLCWSLCDANADCQFWVRESGTSGDKTCWLRKDAGKFSPRADRRGALKQMRRLLDIQTSPKPALRGACASC